MVSAARKAIESMYKGVCAISEYQPVKDPITKLTSDKEVEVLIDIPCRLSFKTIDSATADNAAGITQIVTLFVAPEITVNPGSKITVAQNNVTTAYQRSGKPAIYTNHQEVILELYEDKA